MNAAVVIKILHFFQTNVFPNNKFWIVWMVGSNLYVHPERKVCLWLCNFFAVEFSSTDENSDEKIISKNYHESKSNLVYSPWFLFDDEHQQMCIVWTSNFQERTLQARKKNMKNKVTEVTGTQLAIASF